MLIIFNMCVCVYYIRVLQRKDFCIADKFQIFIVTLNVILISNTAISEPGYGASRSFLLVQVHYSFNTFQFILPATCLLQPLPYLWALGNKIFMSLHQVKEPRATDAALLVAPLPYLFQDVEERELGPTKAFNPSRSPSPVQQVGPR